MLTMIMNLFRYFCLLTLSAYMFFATVSCERETDIIHHQPPQPEEKRLPIDYVFLFDNSGSIPQGEPRTFARQAMKAFIELAEINDKISIITFDRNADLIANVVLNNASDRRRLNNAIDRNLNFTGGYTNITSAFSLLNKKKNSILRGFAYAKPFVILISDGKLEPPGNVYQSYEVLRNEYFQISEFTSFYTLGLGNNDIYDFFWQDINGFKLLNNIAKKSDGMFFQIKSVNDLLDACIKMLRISKEYGEITDREVFLTDESTEKLILLVLKRLPNQQLCRSKDISITNEQNETIYYGTKLRGPNDQTKILWEQGIYYDLITISDPGSNRWTIKIKDLEHPRIQALIKHHIKLRYQFKHNYWAQERKMLYAWLYDDRIGALSAKPYKVTARLDTIENLNYSKNILDLVQTAKDIFVSPLQFKGDRLQTGNYRLEIRATDSSGYFFRNSPEMTIHVRESYFQLNTPPAIIGQYPLFKKNIAVTAMLDTAHHRYPQFREPPKIKLYVNKIEDGEIKTIAEENMPWQISANNLLYSYSINGLQRGAYYLNFQLMGELKSGKSVEINSENFHFSIEWEFWVWFIFIGLLIILVYFLLYVFRPQLIGKLDFIEPTGNRSIMLSKNKKTKRAISEEQLRFGGEPPSELSRLQNTKFILFVKRRRKYYIRRILGNILIVRDNSSFPVSRVKELFRNDIIEFTDNRDHYKIRIIGPKRKPRKRK